MTSSTDIRVGGLARLSSCDWPGELAATVFLQGCPWRCPYCHNTHLLQMGEGDGPAWSEVKTFLATRMGLLDAVIFSGGEPTVQPALIEGVREVRALGFKIGLHTGGPFPDRFAELLPLLDWVGFDVKSPWADYSSITGAPGSGEAARQSLRSLAISGVEFEVRTTVHPDLLGAQALTRMAEELALEGVSRWVLQPYRAEGTSGALPPVRFDASDVPPAVAERFSEFVVR